MGTKDKTECLDSGSVKEVVYLIKEKTDSPNEKKGKTAYDILEDIINWFKEDNGYPTYFNENESQKEGSKGNKKKDKKRNRLMILSISIFVLSLVCLFLPLFFNHFLSDTNIEVITPIFWEVSKLGLWLGVLLFIFHLIWMNKKIEEDKVERIKKAEQEIQILFDILWIKENNGFRIWWKDIKGAPQSFLRIDYKEEKVISVFTMKDYYYVDFHLSKNEKNNIEKDKITDNNRDIVIKGLWYKIEGMYDILEPKKDKVYYFRYKIEEWEISEDEEVVKNIEKHLKQFQGNREEGTKLNIEYE